LAAAGDNKTYVEAGKIANRDSMALCNLTQQANADRSGASEPFMEQINGCGDSLRSITLRAPVGRRPLSSHGRPSYQP
jgi:hypothetical protein